MEANENNELLIGAYIKRNDFRDAIISEKIKHISDLKDGVKIDQVQKKATIKKINSKFRNIRGNIDTRIDKIGKHNLDGVILAAAGVKSLR